MRFDLPESITAMRAGRKTQTRRRDPRLFWMEKRAGQRITVVHQDTNLGWALITCRPRRQQLKSMSAREVEREGYPSWGAFYGAWLCMYPADLYTTEVTVIEFGPVHWRKL